jgi:hypothetical protein
MEQLELLLEIATPDLYRANAFRIAGLPVTATRREVSKRGTRLKRELELGAPQNDQAAAFTLEPRPDADAVQNALGRLENPPKRLVDEFFWFWPLSWTQNGHDEAQAALAKGETKMASDIWRSIATSDSRWTSACHNLAILEHVLALDIERMALSQSLNSEDIGDLDTRWNRLVEIWTAAISNEALWRNFGEHVVGLQEPQLTTETVERLRTTLPLGLALVNADLALRHVQQHQAEKRAAGDPDEGRGREQDRLSRHASRQRQVLAAWQRALNDGDSSVVEEACRRAAATPERRLTALCESSQASAEADPRHADQAARRLLDQSEDLLAQLSVFDDQGKQRSDHARDDVGLAVLRCMVGYGDKTNDWETSIELHRLGLAVAASEPARAKLRENLKNVEELAKSGARWCKPGYFDLPEPLLAVLEKARSDLKSQQHDRAVTALSDVYRGQGPTGEILPDQRLIVANTLAIVFFRRSVFTWNTALREVNTAPDPLIETIISRVKANQVSMTTWMAANMDNPGRVGVPLECMACGTGIQGSFAHIQINEKVRAVVCRGCHSDRDRTRKGKLRPALKEAAGDMVLAQHFSPNEPSFQENAATLRSQMTDMGGIDMPGLEECLIDRGLVTAEYLISLLGTSSRSSSAEKKLAGMGVKALPALLAALDNMPALVPPLIEQLGAAALEGLLAFLAQAPSEKSAITLVRMLAKLHDARAIPPLVQLLETSLYRMPVPAPLCCAIALALEGFGSAAAIALPCLLAAANQGEPSDRIAFIAAAAAVAGPNAGTLTECLVAWLAAEEPVAVRVGAARALEGIGVAAATALPALWKAASLGDPTTCAVMIQTAVAVGKDRAEDLVGHLATFLAEDTPDSARKAAARGIASFGAAATRALPALFAAADKGTAETRVALIQTLLVVAAEHPKELVDRLVGWLADASPEVRAESARMLGQMGEAASSATEKLVQALRDASREVRTAARAALDAVAPEAARKLRFQAQSRKVGAAAAVLLLTLGGFGVSYRYSAATNQGDMGAVRLFNAFGVLGRDRAVEILLTKTLPRDGHAKQGTEGGDGKTSLGNNGTVAKASFRAQLLSRLNGIDPDWRHLPMTGSAISTAVAQLGTCAREAYPILRDNLDFLDPDWRNRAESKAAVSGLVASWTATSTPVPWETLGPWADIVAELGRAAEPMVPVLSTWASRHDKGGTDEAAASKAEEALRTLGKLGVAAAPGEAGGGTKTEANLEHVKEAAALCVSPKSREEGVAKLTAFLEVGEEEQAKLALTTLGRLGPGAAAALPAIRRATTSDKTAIALLARQVVDQLDRAAQPARPKPAGHDGPSADDLLKGLFNDKPARSRSLINAPSGQAVAAARVEPNRPVKEKPALERSPSTMRPRADSSSKPRAEEPIIPSAPRRASNRPRRLDDSF